MKKYDSKNYEREDLGRMIKLRKTGGNKLSDVFLSIKIPAFYVEIHEFFKIHN